MSQPPISFEALVENSMDPSHAPHLHEGGFAEAVMAPMTDFALEAPLDSSGAAS